MSHDIRFLNMREAGAYLGHSYRWMQRHYPALLDNGVIAYRLPKDSLKGQLLFERKSLDGYLEQCRIN